MIVVHLRRWPVEHDHLYFASPGEVAKRAAAVRPGQVLWAHQCHGAPSNLPRRRNQLHAEVYETLIADLTRSEDELLKAMHPSRCRYMIRVAERVEKRIRVGRNEPATAGDFLRVYNALAASKRHLAPMSLRELTAWQSHGDAFVAYLDGQPLCAQLCLVDRGLGRAVGIRAASMRLEGGEAGRLSGALNRYLYWHVMRTYRREGLSTWDFGGVGTADPEKARIAEFKLSFGGLRVVERSYVFGGSLARIWLLASRSLRALKDLKGVSGSRQVAKLVASPQPGMAPGGERE